MKFRLSANLLISLSIWLFLGALWLGLSFFEILNKAFIPTPVEVFKSVLSLGFWEDFSLDLWASVSRLFLGLLLAYFISLFLILIGVWVSGFELFLRQLNSLLKYIPPPVIIPFSILFLGITDSAIIATVTVSSLILYLNYCLSIRQKEEQNYDILKKSWGIKPLTSFSKFFVPISNYLNYRILPGVIIWSLGIVVISEIILGRNEGLGVRVLQYQQIYQTGNLFLLVFLIVLLAFGLEFFLKSFFARRKWDSLKIISAVLIVCTIVASFGYQIKESFFKSRNDPAKTIVTYKTTLNLPIFVYLEKYNTLGLTSENVSSGIQVVDSILAKKAVLGGYSDLPNVLTAKTKNDQLKILSQVVEKPDHPSLFLISKKPISSTDYSSLEGSRVGYYPNNPLILKGLEFVFLLNKANSSDIQFVGSNDPSSLSQGLASDQLQAFLSVEPFIANTEDQFDLERVNPRQTVIRGLSFETLPLASLVADTSEISASELKSFDEGITKSIDFIRENTGDNFKAEGELLEIMKKYDLNPGSSLSAFQSSQEIESKDLSVLIDLLKVYGVEGIPEGVDPESYYFRP